MDFLAAPISTDSAVARLDDIATNGNLGAELANTKTLWAVMVLQNIEGTASGARVLALGTSSGNTDFSVVKVDGDQWYVRWDQEAGGGNYQGDFYQAMTTDQPMVMVVQVNTESAVAEDRLKVWIDGQPRTISTNNIPQDATLSLVNDTDRILTVGNRGSQNRNMKGQVFYAELGTGVLSDVQVASIYSGLSANNDAAWVEGQTPSAPQVIALVEGQSLTQTELVSLAAFMVPGTVSAQQLVQGSPVEIGQASAQAVSAVVAQQVVQSQTASISTITSAILGLTQQITSAETLDTTTKAQAITAVIEQVTQADALSLTEVQNVLSVVAQQLTQTEVAVIDQGGQALVAATLEQVSQSQVLSVAQIATVTGVLAESQVQANTATVAATYTMNTVTLEQLTQAELIALTYGDGLTVVAVEQTTDFVLPPLTVTMFGAPEMLEAEQLTEGVSPLTAAVMVVTCADIEQITEAEIADVIGTAKQLNPRSLRVNRTTIGYTVNRKSTGFTVTLKTTS